MTLQKVSFKDVHEPCSGNDRGHVHEGQRLRIEELDEWRAHKLRTHDKPKLCQNKPDTSPNQLKVGNKDATDPHIVTTTSNVEIPLTVLSIFPFNMGVPKAVANKGRDTTMLYFIAFAIRHQTEWHRKGMSLEGITTMLHMRMIERRRGTDPPQYHLTHAIDKEDLEDIPDDVPPQHEEPPTTPPRERPIHATASLAHLSN
ncbi:hypothetical protein GOBAR_AA05249 [Gossypium barbadense]|uniref:Uncharacterized protein n=1 Tax=Gossypium barbadense TaxID=3634 RepID=A0A2P5YIB3_GOSBA|nr:hypothetical protein GOBAR_AA05249 [Gossypium barbadense]